MQNLYFRKMRSQSIHGEICKRKILWYSSSYYITPCLSLWKCLVLLRIRRLQTPILQGFLSVKIAKTIFYTFTLKNGLLLRNAATKKLNNCYPHSSTTEQEILKKRTSCFFFCQNQKGEPMQENTQTAIKTTAAPKPHTVKRKIGKTTYELSLHFSQTSTERMSDKVMRLLENDLSAKKWGKLFSMSLTNRPKRYSFSRVRKALTA